MKNIIYLFPKSSSPRIEKSVVFADDRVIYFGNGDMSGDLCYHLRVTNSAGLAK